MHGRSLAVLGFVLLACRPEAKPIAAPASGGDFVAASATQEAPDRAWRDALRADRQAIRIPDHTPVRGAKEPLVTIVQFGDYTDAASATQARAVADALQRWPGDVSIAFVQLPSRSRRVSRLAAETAASAGGAEAFWQIHDRLFATPPKTPEACTGGFCGGRRRRFQPRRPDGRCAGAAAGAAHAGTGKRALTGFFRMDKNVPVSENSSRQGPEKIFKAGC